MLDNSSKSAKLKVPSFCSYTQMQQKLIRSKTTTQSVYMWSEIRHLKMPLWAVENWWTVSLFCDILLKIHEANNQVNQLVGPQENDGQQFLDLIHRLSPFLRENDKTFSVFQVFRCFLCLYSYKLKIFVFCTKQNIKMNP